MSSDQSVIIDPRNTDEYKAQDENFQVVDNSFVTKINNSHANTNCTE